MALTGATIDRVTAAVTLLENEKGRRLLVSGVNPEVKPRELQEVSKAAKGLFNCCIQMGFEAADTHGNAAETAAWARRQGYRRLIIVTADYHMPRAILEIRRAAPNVELTPYPVATREVDARRWWKTSGGARRMILEYCKYLAVLGSEAFLKLGPKPDK